MGVIYYAVLEKPKVLIELGKHINEYDIEEDKIKEFYNAVNNFNIDVLNERYRDITVKDLAEAIRISDLAFSLFADNPHMFIIAWLVLNGIKFEIVSDYEIHQNKEKYKDYVEIAPYVDFEF